MSHPHLTALIGSAIAHVLHPHHHGHDQAHPFGEGVKLLGEDATLPAGADAYAEGKRRLQSGEVEGALAAFRQAVADHPDSAEALDGLAVSWDRLGRPDLARIFYEEALAKAPDSASIQNNLGYSYWLAGDPDRARPLLSRAAQASDPRVAAAARRTLTLMDRPRSTAFSDTIPESSSAVRLAASSGAVIERLSATRVALVTRSPALDPGDSSSSPRRVHQVSMAVAPVQTSASGLIAPADVAAHPPVLLRAAAPAQADLVDDAVLRRPVFDSDDARLNAFAARVHAFRPRRMGRAEIDCGAIQVTPSATPASAPAVVDAQGLAHQIDAALRSGATDEAGALIESGATVVPGPLLSLYKAQLALRSGDADAAALGFATLTDHPILASRAWAGLGEARLRQKRAAPAAEALDRSLALDPSQASVWVMRGVTADMLRDWRAADLAYDRAIALDPTSAAALTDRGYSRLLRGRYLEALADLKRAVELDPKSKIAVTDLRVASVMSGDYKGATAGMGKQEVAEDLNTLGFAAMARGDYDRAETFFTRAMEINPRFDHVAWDNLVYLKQRIHESPDLAATP